MRAYVRRHGEVSQATQAPAQSCCSKEPRPSLAPTIELVHAQLVLLTKFSDRQMALAIRGVELGPVVELEGVAHVESLGVDGFRLDTD